MGPKTKKMDLMPKATLKLGMVDIMAILDTMDMEDTMAEDGDMDMDIMAARNVRLTLLLLLPLMLHLLLSPILDMLLELPFSTTLFPTPTLLLTKMPLLLPVKWT